MSIFRELAHFIYNVSFVEVKLSMIFPFNHLINAIAKGDPFTTDVDHLCPLLLFFHQSCLGFISLVNILVKRTNFWLCWLFSILLIPAFISVIAFDLFSVNFPSFHLISESENLDN